MHAQTEERVYGQEFADNLRRQVVQIIAAKEEEIETSFKYLTDRIDEKEADIAHLKRLFFDKLRELESSFVELSQDMIETEVVQQEASRKMSQQMQKSRKSGQASRDLEQSLEHIVGGIDEDQEEQI